MQEQTLIQFRADKALKDEVTQIYESLGMDLPTALRMFLVRSKISKGLPFSATMPVDSVSQNDAIAAFNALRQQAKEIPEMSIDEINEEISQARKERR